MTGAVFSVAAFVLGAVVGSFLNAVIHRLPRGLRLDRPRRSFCPLCSRTIPWHENIPLVSWLWLRGRCAGCGGGISGRYFLVELLTALLFLAAARSFSPTAAVAAVILLSLLVAATFIDLEHLIIPDSITLGGAAAGLACAVLLPGLHPGEAWWERLGGALLGAAVGFGVLYAVVEVGRLVFGRQRHLVEPPEPFRLETDPQGVVRLCVGEEALDLSEVFPRPSDVLVLELRDGLRKLRLRPTGWEDDGRLVPYSERLPDAGEVAVLVVPREAMGFGDVKFMATIGAFLGWGGALFAIAAGSMIGAVFGVAALLSGKLDVSGRIPFGPYLAAGAALWLFYGPQLASWYGLR